MTQGRQVADDSFRLRRSSLVTISAARGGRRWSYNQLILVLDGERPASARFESYERAVTVSLER